MGLPAAGGGCNVAFTSLAITNGVLHRRSGQSLLKKRQNQLSWRQISFPLSSSHTLFFSFSLSLSLLTSLKLQGIILPSLTLVSQDTKSSKEQEQAESKMPVKWTPENDQLVCTFLLAFPLQSSVVQSIHCLQPAVHPPALSPFPQKSFKLTTVTSTASLEDLRNS